MNEAVDDAAGEVSLLDLLLVVAENLKLLIVGPLLIGLVALGGTYLMPQKFVSEAYLRLTVLAKDVAFKGNDVKEVSAKDVDAVMHSPLVLDAVYRQFYPQESLTEANRKAFAASYKLVDTVKKEANAPSMLQVESASPQRAQAIASAIIDAWFATTLPMPETKIELERKLAQNKAAFAEVSGIIERLTRESAKLSVPTLQYDIATPLVQLLRIRNEHLDQIRSIELSLRGASPDVVMAKPTLPTESVSPKKGLIAVMATLAGGFVLLLWVFMRSAWRNAAQDPEQAQKQSRLAAALRWGK